MLKNEFVKNSLTLFSGVSLAQAILLAITPILSRLYGNEVFGIYFLFSSIIVILKILSTLRIELSIMLAKRDKDAINLFCLTFFVNIFMNVIFLLLIIIFNDFINSLFGEKNLGKFIYLIPLATFFVGLFEMLNIWNNRKKHYTSISASKITKAASQGGWNLAFGFANLPSIGLIPAYIFAYLSASVVLISKSFRELLLLLKFISIKRMLFLIIKYKDIPRFNTIINLMVNIGNELPVLLMTSFFGPAIVGLYGMANKLIAAPSDLISRSVGQVFFQRASEKYSNDENIHDLLKKTFKNLLKIALLIFIPALIIAPFLKYILGIEWEMTGFFAMIIVPAIFTKFLFVPVSSIYTILNQQKKMFFYFFVNLVFRIIAIYLGFAVF
ncbi:MAG: oligosaccharide flippase family protein, partial [Bacteroidota bacterium]|nr:oligosaccharide flippase family protein [Bacteroidota bacterium]